MEQLLKNWKLRMVKYRQEADNANTPITRVKAMNKFFIYRDCIKELEEQLTTPGVVKSLPNDYDLGAKLNKYIIKKSLDTESVYTETDAYIDIYKLANIELKNKK